MSGLTRLEGSFTEGNVPLALLLGVLSATARLRVVLPDAPYADAPDGVLYDDDGDDRDDTVAEPFVAMLLGALVVHDRLSRLVPTGDHEPRSHAAAAAREPTALGRLLR